MRVPGYFASKNMFANRQVWAAEGRRVQWLESRVEIFIWNSTGWQTATEEFPKRSPHTHRHTHKCLRAGPKSLNLEANFATVPRDRGPPPQFMLDSSKKRSISTKISLVISQSGEPSSLGPLVPSPFQLASASPFSSSPFSVTASCPSKFNNTFRLISQLQTHGTLAVPCRRQALEEPSASSIVFPPPQFSYNWLPLLL